MRPWSVKGTPLSSPGGPFEDKPQRHNSSSKPRNHPRPFLSESAASLGCTGPCTGECQPRKFPRYSPRQTPMPRVGKIEYDRDPLCTSMRSTPSRTPPRNVRLRIDQSYGVGRRKLSLPTEKLSSQISLARSARVQDLVRDKSAILPGF